MLGHQTDDGLIRVEVDVAVQQENHRPDEHQNGGKRAEKPRFAPSAVENGLHRHGAQYTACTKDLRSIFVSMISTLGHVLAVW